LFLIQFRYASIAQSVEHLPFKQRVVGSIPTGRTFDSAASWTHNLLNCFMTKNKNTVLVLDNIRSVFNVGSIFRTAECAGVIKIYLLGVTPDPIDRFGRERKDLAKVALGAEKKVLWEHIKDIGALIKKLKTDGYQVVALEQSEDSTDYKKFKPKFPLALVLGEEVSGLNKESLDLCDSVIEIPMMGEKESLNVSVATGVTLFRILNV
jgi:23S rRNA (guanosine2251-2'-O)-methyltransferase